MKVAITISGSSPHHVARALRRRGIPASVQQGRIIAEAPIKVLKRALHLHELARGARLEFRIEAAE